MKKEKLNPSYRVIIIITLLSVSLLFTESSGANSKKQTTRISSAKQILQIPKTTYKPLRRKTTDPSTLKPEMPFSEAINILRNSTVPPLNIVVLWKDLQENAGVDRETPIGTDGLSGVPLRTHLKVLLMSISAGGYEKVGYAVDEGVIIISTQSSLPRKRVTRIYDVSDLVSEPANYRFPGFGMPFGFGGMMGGGMFGGGMMPGGVGGYGGQGFLGSGPYRSKGRAYIGTNSLRSNSNSNYLTSGSAVAYRSRELVDLIETLYGSNR